MSLVIKITPENRLAAILVTMGGYSADEMIAEADRRTEQLGDAIRAYIAEKLEFLMPYAERSDEDLFAARDDVHAAAVNIAEVAGAAKLAAIGEVARGVVAMTDDIEAGVWQGDALRLHIESLRLVATTAGDLTEEDAAVVEHLQAMRTKLGVEQ